MTRFWLSLGSNVEPEKNIPACLEALQRDWVVKKISSVYEMEPVGPAGGAKFWNACVTVESPLTKEDFVKEMRALEDRLGRRRDPANKFAPRTIDIDLLPAPGYQEQFFTVIPLAEIAPEEKDPETGKTFRELAAGIRRENRLKFRQIRLP